MGLLTNWRVLLAGAGLVGLLAGVAAVESHRLDRARRDEAKAVAAAETWKHQAAAWEASFRRSEALRAGEHQGGVRDAEAEQAACEARLVAARHQSAAIAAIVQRAPAAGPNGEPREEIITASELDAALPRL